MSSQSSEDRGRKTENNAKRLARLASVQALYQIELTKRTAKEVVQDFQLHPPEILIEDNHTNVTEMDKALFSTIVNGVSDNLADMDAMLGGALDAKLSVPRLETLLRGIFRAGAFELHHCPATNTGVIINDYVDVTKSFFNEKEPGLVNAVLDKLAKKLRT